MQVRRWSTVMTTLAALSLGLALSAGAAAAPAPLAAPVATPSAPLTGVADIAAGNEWHSCAVTDAGGVMCWGFNNAGQLGDGTQTNRAIATPVIGLGAIVVSVVGGGGHTCALTTQGGVKCWGYNADGQLGIGSFGDSPTPVDVVGLASGVVALAAGDHYTCAVMAGGGAKCWGKNDFGQLGDGTYERRLTPVDVSGLTSGVADIAAGFNHTCAVTDTGAALCWGQNTDGQLGDGTTAHRSSPGTVTGLDAGVSTMSLGWFHTCAVMTGGAAKCWGNNTYGGQLGDGTKVNRTTPVDVIGIPSGLSAITAGYWHTCAVTTTGAAVCWGDNDSGKLGDGTTTDRSVPVPVTGLASGVSAISAGFYHTCAVATDAAKCWGGNYYSQLGDGTTTTRRTPVDVLITAPPPVVRPGFASVLEGDSGSVVVNVPVTLSNPSVLSVTVDWTTVNSAYPGVASAGVDFVAASGTVTFAPGETAKYVPITVRGDTVVEPPPDKLSGEWGIIAFSNPTNATLARSFYGLGLFIVIDDDPPST